MSIQAFNIELNSHFIVKYNNKTRIVIPFKALNDGYLVYENNVVKRFKLMKMQKPNEDEVASTIYNYDFENNINTFMVSSETETDEEMKEPVGTDELCSSERIAPEVLRGKADSDNVPVYNTINDVVLEQPVEITYHDKRRVVVPIQILHDGFIAMEEGKVKHFKFNKIQLNQPLSWSPWEMRNAETQVLEDDPAFHTPRRTRAITMPSAPKKMKLNL